MKKSAALLSWLLFLAQAFFVSSSALAVDLIEGQGSIQSVDGPDRDLRLESPKKKPKQKMLPQADNSNSKSAAPFNCENPEQELAASQHKVSDCLRAGGKSFATAEGCLCQFQQAACPPSWTQHQSWSATASRECIGDGCNATSCSTGFHEFQNEAIEFCSFNNAGVQEAKGGCNGSVAQSCYAAIKKIGCR